MGERRRSRFLATVAVALAMLAAACGDDDTVAIDVATPTVEEPTPAPTETPAPTTPPPAGPVSLVADGLGVAGFGDDMDTAFAALTAALGAPSGDQTTTGDMPDGLGGPGTALRIVEFGQLSVSFVDWPYFRDDGAMHLVRWILFDFTGTGTASLATPEGITLGSTVDDLRAAYGDRLALPDEPDPCTGGWHFQVGDAAELGIQGRLTGPPGDPASTVAFLTAGAQSSC